MAGNGLLAISCQGAFNFEAGCKLSHATEPTRGSSAQSDPY